MKVPRILQELDGREHVSKVVVGQAIVVCVVKLGPPHACHRVRFARFRVVGCAQSTKLGW